MKIEDKIIQNKMIEESLKKQKEKIIKIVERIPAIFDIKTQDYLVGKRKIIKKIKGL